MTRVDAEQDGVRGRLVKVAFLVRLLALAYSTLMTVVSDATPASGLLLGALMLTSHFGLQSERVRTFVVQRPATALLDVVPVAVAPLILGPDSPIFLVGLSSALLVGVLFPIRLVVPLLLLLATTHAQAVLHHGGDGLGALRDPVVLVTLASLGVAVRRLTEQQLRAEQSRAAALEAAAAAEERLRLARDLHDTVAKSVQAIALTASALPAWVKRDPVRAVQYAGMVADAAREAVAAARDMLVSLRLDDSSRPFAEVVEQLVDRWDAQHATVTSRQLQDVPHLSPGHRHELLWAMSEALENVRRHAPGAKVAVSLEAEVGHVVLSVADSGPGIPPGRQEQACADGHFGLCGIQERLENIGGSAQVSTSPRGTRVTLRVSASSPFEALTGAESAGRARILSRSPVKAGVQARRAAS